MKTQKRILAWVLCAAFLWAGAPVFAAADEVADSDVPGMMVKLGIFEGGPDGSIDIQGTVTRGEMARIMTKVMIGNQKGTFSPDMAIGLYSDTVGDEDDPYISFCTGIGIISGRGDGTYGPDDSVTAREAAKMLLMTLGYAPSFERMEGEKWAVGTEICAQDSGLFEGLDDLDHNAAIRRGDLGRMILNALTATSVIYKAKVTGVGEAGEAQLAPERVAGDKVPRLKFTFKMRIVDGEMVPVEE